MSKSRLRLISDCYKLYVLDAKARPATPATIQTYEDRIVPFLKWCESIKLTTINSINPDTVRSYFIHLTERELSDYTVNGVGRALRAFFNFCVNERLLSESPMRTVKIPKIAKRIKPSLSADDIKRLLEACQSERDELIILLLLDTGVRATELVNLNIGDIDPTMGTVLVRQGKGSKDRSVYIGNKTRKQLQRHLLERDDLSDHQPLFQSQKTQQRLTTGGLRVILVRLCEDAGIRRIAPHAFRRTFAISSLRAGMSIYHLQRLMGHADIDVLKIYLDLVDGDAQKAAQQFGVVDHLK